MELLPSLSFQRAVDSTKPQEKYLLGDNCYNRASLPCRLFMWFKIHNYIPMSTNTIEDFLIFVPILS